MRRATVFFLAFVLIFSVPFSSFAEEGVKISIQELNLSVVVPAGYDAFTRDTAVNDPLYSKYGISHDQMLSTMKAQGSYLDAISSDRKTEIAISAFSTSNSDLNQLSDASILAMGSALKEQYSKNGLTVTSYDIYSHSQTKFLKFLAHRSASGSTIHTLQYTTVFGGKTINISLQSYSGTGVSSSQESIMEKIVESVEFIVSSAKKTSSAISSENSLSATKSDSSIVSTSTQTNQGSSSGFILFYLAIAATVVYIGLHYFFRERNKAKANEKEVKQTTPNKVNPPASNQPQATERSVSNGALRNTTLQESVAPKYCRKCGNRLLSDSIFCDHCGTKVQ